MRFSVAPYEANDLATQAGWNLPEKDGDCLQRVCLVVDGEFFSFWTDIQVNGPAADHWLGTNESAFLPKFSDPCPGNESVTICHLDGLDYKLVSINPESAD